MAEKSYTTAPCSVCGREMRVLKDGVIGHHGGKRYGDGFLTRYREYRCSGAGQPPAIQREVDRG